MSGAELSMWISSFDKGQQMTHFTPTYHLPRIYTLWLEIVSSCDWMMNIKGPRSVGHGEGTFMSGSTGNWHKTATYIGLFSPVQASQDLVSS